jgi:hypothetical protein
LFAMTDRDGPKRPAASQPVPAERRNKHGEPRATLRGPQPNLALINDVRKAWAEEEPRHVGIPRLAEKYDLTADTVSDYWKRVAAEHELHDESEIDEARAKKIRRLKSIGAKAEASADWTAALKAEAMQIALLGLNAAKKLDVTVTSGVLVVGGGPSEGQTAEDWAAAHSVTTTARRGKP